MHACCHKSLPFFRQIPSLLSDISCPLQNHEIKVLPGADIDSEIYIRSELVLNGYGIDSKQTNIKEMNITKSSVGFFDINFAGHINILEKSKFSASNCVFTCSNDKQENIITISPDTDVEFNNCVFFGGTKATVSITGVNIVVFNDCTFSDAAVASVVVCTDSSVQFNRCKFYTAMKYSVLVTKRANTSFKQCEFENLPGKGITMCTEAIVSVTESKFTSCEGGAITACEFVILKLLNNTFEKIGFAAVSLMKGSNSYLSGNTFKNCVRSLIISKSYAEITDSIFDSSALLIMGKYMPQLINNNQFSSLELLIGDDASPMFLNNKMEKVLVRTCDYAKPIFTNSDISELIAVNCSQVILFNSKRESEKSIIGAEIIDVDSEQFEIQRDNGTFKFKNGEYVVPFDYLKYEPPNGYSDAKYVFFPCAHVCDSECSQCPVCGIAGKTVQRFKSETCVACMEKAPEVVFLPCGHQCCCFECGHSCGETKKCPMCGSTANVVKRVFM